MDMDTTSVGSEKGGIGKTTLTAALAAELASRGVLVGVMDIDPRHTVTKLLDVEPRSPGEHIGAIAGVDDVAGAAADIAVTSPWHPNIQVVPGSRDLAALESAPQEYGEIRLRDSLAGWDRDVVLFDLPNRQGGFLIRMALTASRRILYAAVADEDGRDGVADGRKNTERFKTLSGLNPHIEEAGIILTRWPDTVTTRNALTYRDLIDEENPGMLLRPFVPERVIVQEARAGCVWFGAYPKGAPVVAAFADLTDTLWPAYARKEALR